MVRRMSCSWVVLVALFGSVWGSETEARNVPGQILRGGKILAETLGIGRFDARSYVRLATYGNTLEWTFDAATGRWSPVGGFGDLAQRSGIVEADLVYVFTKPEAEMDVEDALIVNQLVQALGAAARRDAMWPANDLLARLRRDAAGGEGNHQRFRKKASQPEADAIGRLVENACGKRNKAVQVCLSPKWWGTEVTLGCGNVGVSMSVEEGVKLKVGHATTIVRGAGA